MYFRRDDRILATRLAIPLVTRQRPRSAGLSLKALVVFAVVPLVACSVTAEATPPAPESSTVHALVQVRRVESAEGDVRGDAVAGFLRVPLSQDPAPVFSLAGLRRELPAAGQCRADRGSLAKTTDDDAGNDPVELVPAEEIELFTPNGRHELVPHAFPSVTDRIRGVIYTSRDQTALSLPEGTSYTFLRKGEDELGTIEATRESPHIPSGILVSGVPLAERTNLPHDVVDLSWQPSQSPLDAVAVTLRASDAVYTCSFRDAYGFGSLSLGEARAAFDDKAFESGAHGTLSVHRIRAEASAGAGDASVVEVRFDFSVAQGVEFD